MVATRGVAGMLDVEPEDVGLSTQRLGNVSRLVQSYVAAWAGPDALIGGVDIRLGVPCYAYETLVLSGRVVRRTDGEVEVAVVGKVSLGDHVTGTVLVRTGAAA